MEKSKVSIPEEVPEEQQLLEFFHLKGVPNCEKEVSRVTQFKEGAFGILRGDHE